MRKRYASRRILFITVGLFFVCMPIALRLDFADAATLVSVSDTLNIQTQNQSEGIVHTVSFTVPSGNVLTEDSITMTFPDADDATWCATAGSDMQISSSSHGGATPLPGTLTAACSQGAGTSSFDTFTISGVSDLTALTTYAFMVSDGAITKLGTPNIATTGEIFLTTRTALLTPIDTKQFWVDIIPSSTVSVTATVPTQEPPETAATVTFSGYAYPNAGISILRDSIQVATGTANASGVFSIVVTSDPGTYTFSVVGTDSQSTQSPLLHIALSLSSGAVINASNLFLGPTITQSATSVEEGQTITFSGYSLPNSTVTLTVNSPQTIHLAATANSAGFWSETVSSTPLSTGNHTARAQSSLGALVSEFSNTLHFIVTGAAVDVCDGMVSSDINCDSAVNLVDFSILLYFWEETNPANSRADINGDTQVNETDFSIMLFEWTG